MVRYFTLAIVGQQEFWLNCCPWAHWAYFGGHHPKGSLRLGALASFGGMATRERSDGVSKRFLPIPPSPQSSHNPTIFHFSSLEAIVVF